MNFRLGRVKMKFQTVKLASVAALRGIIIVLLSFLYFSTMCSLGWCVLYACFRLIGWVSLFIPMWVAIILFIGAFTGAGLAVMEIVSHYNENKPKEFVWLGDEYEL